MDDAKSVLQEPFAEWLEDSIREIMGDGETCFRGQKPSEIAIIAKNDQTVFTSYYHCNAQDKAIFVHNINIDIMADVMKANADTFRQIFEGGGENE